jgi:hypothetical protein
MENIKKLVVDEVVPMSNAKYESKTSNDMYLLYHRKTIPLEYFHFNIIKFVLYK